MKALRMTNPASISSPHPLDRLIADQHVVLSVLERAHECGVDTPVGASLLGTLRRPLEAYLAICDGLIYPSLEELAERDRELLRSLADVRPHRALLAQVRAFFERHADVRHPAIMEDWALVYLGVRRRLRLERERLFPVLRASRLANDLELPTAGPRRPGRSGVVLKER